MLHQPSLVGLDTSRQHHRFWVTALSSGCFRIIIFLHTSPRKAHIAEFPPVAALED